MRMLGGTHRLLQLEAAIVALSYNDLGDVVDDKLDEDDEGAVTCKSAS
jgi:hypothetical protein